MFDFKAKGDAIHAKLCECHDFRERRGGKARETPSKRSVSKETVTSVLMEQISCTTWDEKSQWDELPTSTSVGFLPTVFPRDLISIF